METNNLKCRDEFIKRRNLIISSINESQNEIKALEPIIMNSLFTSMARYSFDDVANYFLSKESMTHSKLQKLCYYAQAYCYAFNDCRLMNADFKPWAFGPISGKILERFGIFGDDDIKIFISHKPKFDEKTEKVLNYVWEVYGNSSDKELELLSITEEPFKKAQDEFIFKMNTDAVITLESMKAYFSKYAVSV